MVLLLQKRKKLYTKQNWIIKWLAHPDPKSPFSSTSTHATAVRHHHMNVPTCSCTSSDFLLVLPAGPCCWWTRARCPLTSSPWLSSSVGFSTRRERPSSNWSSTPSSPHWAPNTRYRASTEPCRYVLRTLRSWTEVHSIVCRVWLSV